MRKHIRIILDFEFTDRKLFILIYFLNSNKGFRNLAYVSNSITLVLLQFHCHLISFFKEIVSKEK